MVEDEQLRRVTANAPIFYYGLNENNDFIAYDLKPSTTGSQFKVRHGEEELGEFQIPTFGKHNVMNATAVIATPYVAGFDLQLVAEHLKTS